MFRSVAALSSVVAVSVLFGACSQSPTAPTSATGSFSLGSVSQEPPSVPASIIPTPPQALGATRFMAFGDSITCGVESLFDSLIDLQCPSGAWGYPDRLRAMLAARSAGQTFSMNKRGKPGEWAIDGATRLQSELNELLGSAVPLAQRPEALLLLEGINDMNNGASAAQAAARLAQLAHIARLFNLTVLVATMPQTYESTDPNTGQIRQNSADKIVPFNTELRSLLNGIQNVYIVDIHAAFGSNQALIGGDGLHPTPAGYDRMAQTFEAAIVTRFPVRGSLQ